MVTVETVISVRGGDEALLYERKFIMDHVPKRKIKSAIRAMELLMIRDFAEKTGIEQIDFEVANEHR